jgi:Rad3-related DNA helicase
MRVVELREEAPLLEGLRRYFPHGELRRYQADIANSVYESLNSGAKNVLLEGPTGLGKRL